MNPNNRAALAAMAIAAVMALNGKPARAAELAGLKNALDGERLGLFSADGFRQVKGSCSDCASVRQGLWYFRDELLAVPRHPETARPGLVWLGSPLLLDEAAILADGSGVRGTDGATAGLLLAPRLASNRAWWDASTTAFFAQRQVRLRGSLRSDGGFVARTVWPRDFVISADKVQTAAQPADLTALVRAGGAQYATRLLWERTPGVARDWKDKAVIGIMLNGAQGDDDEAHGGHFAIATGTLGAKGEWSDWMVNNFYNLDTVSEKGIIAAPVPMDNYLMDVNSGQQYYRPSTMLVAVLRDPRTAMAYQARMQGVFDQFYRHEIVYRHAAANCAGISLDAFRELGWNVPARGPTSVLKAVGAYAFLAARDRSLASGRKIYDYLTEEQVRLYPAVAFDALGTDLLGLVGATGGIERVLTPYEQSLQNDIEALVLVTIPQIPSSRAMGTAPVFSFDEFRQRTPDDQADWKTVPTAGRPFPAELREASSILAAESAPVPLPIAGICAGGMLGVGALWRRRRARRAQR